MIKDKLLIADGIEGNMHSIIQFLYLKLMQERLHKSDIYIIILTTEPVRNIMKNDLIVIELNEAVTP